MRADGTGVERHGNDTNGPRSGASSFDRLRRAGLGWHLQSPVPDRMRDEESQAPQALRRGRRIPKRPYMFDLFVTADQAGDYIGARALLCSLPKAGWLLADRGYNADWFREALQDKGIRACIPGRKQRKTPVKYDKHRYQRRNRIEIMFGRLRDWGRVATRYDRCPKAFLSAIALAAIVIYWSWIMVWSIGNLSALNIGSDWARR